MNGGVLNPQDEMAAPRHPGARSRRSCPACERL